MRPFHRIILLAVLVAVAPALAGCEDFDMEKLDVLGLSKKKPLPGKREDVFPSGVPGVTQGIPPEYMKGYQEKQQAANANAAQPGEPADKAAAGAAENPGAAEEPAEKPKAKPTPKKRIAKRKPKPPAAAAPTPQPAGQQPAQAPWPDAGQQQQPQQSNQAPWPDQGRQPPQQQSAPWPSAPPAGNFSH